MLFTARALTGQSAAPAASTELTLESITISTPAGETTLTSSSTISVLSRQFISDYGFRSISDAVDSRAGVSVQRTYLKQDMLTGRGILQDLYANKNLILIDGIPLWNAVSGEGSLSRVDLSDVRRLEVLRGPASVIYGSQGLTSGVNIVMRTPTPGERSVDLHAAGGTDEIASGGASVRIGFDNGLGVAVSAHQFHGPRRTWTFTDEAGVTGPVTDYFDTQNLTARLSYGGHVLLINRFDNREGFLGTAPSFAQSLGNRHDVDGFSVGYKGRQDLTDIISVEAMSYYDWGRRDYGRATATQERTRVSGYRSGGMVKVVNHLPGGVNAEVGVDYESRFAKEFFTYTPATQTNSIPGRSVWERSAFGQVDWQNSLVRLVAGSRYSENALSGGHLASRATAVYKLSPSQSIKLIAGESYRSPSLLELYTLSPTIRGNPDLKPETATSVEVAYLGNVGPVSVQSTLYRASYDDKIFRVPDPLQPSRNTYINGNTFAATGVEIETTVSLGSAGQVFANVDWIHGNSGDATADSVNPGAVTNNFKYVPKYQAAAGWSKNWGAFSVGSVAHYTASTRGPKAGVGSVLVLDAHVGYAQTFGATRVEYRLRLDNLTDEDAYFPEFSRRRVNEIPSGAGRTVSLETTVSF